MNNTVRNMLDINPTCLNGHFKFELPRYTNYMSENVLVDKTKTNKQKSLDPWVLELTHAAFL